MKNITGEFAAGHLWEIKSSKVLVLTADKLRGGEEVANYPHQSNGTHAALADTESAFRCPIAVYSGFLNILQEHLILWDYASDYCGNIYF